MFQIIFVGLNLLYDQVANEGLKSLRIRRAYSSFQLFNYVKTFFQKLHFHYFLVNFNFVIRLILRNSRINLQNYE